MNKVKIAVIGGGSIGLLVSSYLAKSHDVSLYVRRIEQQKRINENQIHLLKDSASNQIVEVPAFSIEQLRSNHDLYIICVKQPQLKEVLEPFYRNSFTAPLLFLQNGMGHIEVIESLSQQVYVGVIHHGAYRTADNHIHHLGDGSITLASLTGSDSELDRLQVALNQSNFPIQQVTDWELLLKEKVLINAVINPLTALFNVANGEIINNNHIAFLAKEISAETAITLQLPINQAWEDVVRTAEATKENVSSMRADIQAKRPTELEAISGYVLKKANRKLPYTNFVYHAILALS